MSRKVMCAYGNCDVWIGPGDYRITVTITNRSHVSDRQSYCCLEHAWRHLRKTDELHNGRRPDTEVSLNT